ALAWAAHESASGMAAAAPAPPGRRHEHPPAARTTPHDAVFGPSWSMHEVPRSQPPYLALDQQQALAREDEEVFLVRFAVVEAARPAGLDHREGESDVRELASLEARAVANDGHVGLEDAAPAEGLVRQPGCLADVDDEPTVG